MIKSQITPFLAKTYDIIMSNEHSDLIYWTEDGHGFIVNNIPRFENTVLPKYFKHNKFTSFIRQLNMYDFHKTRLKSHQKEFRHVYFCRGKPELLAEIKRKTPEQVEFNHKKIKDALQIADEWKKLEDQIDFKDNSNENVELTGLESGEFAENDFAQKKASCSTASLMMCLMLHNKALQANSEGTSANVSEMIIKHTEDYIASMKAVLDIKVGSSQLATHAEGFSNEDDSSLSKRSFDESFENPKDIQIEGHICQKQIKQNEKIFLENDFIKEEDQVSCYSNIFGEDCLDFDETNFDFCKLNTLDDFQFSLNELSSDPKTFQDLF